MQPLILNIWFSKAGLYCFDVLLQKTCYTTYVRQNLALARACRRTCQGDCAQGIFLLAINDIAITISVSQGKFALAQKSSFIPCLATT